MPRPKKRTPKVEEVRPYGDGVAKNLVDQLSGPDGPAWGTRLTEIEDRLLAVREVLTETMRDDARARQAAATAAWGWPDDEDRGQGRPPSRSLRESVVKAVSRRVKGTEKCWCEEGAEALRQRRADHRRDGEAQDDFWQRRQETATGQRRYRRAG